MFENTQAANRPSPSFFAILFFSVLLHIFVIIKIQWNKPPLIPEEKFIEVDLLKIPDPSPPVKTTTHNYKSPVNQKKVSRAAAGKPEVKTESKTVVPSKPQKPVKPVPPPPPTIEKPVLSVKSKLGDLEGTGTIDQPAPLSQEQLEIPQLQPTKVVEDPGPSPVPQSENLLKSVPQNQPQKKQAADLKNIGVERLVNKNVVSEAKAPVLSDSPQTTPGQQTGNRVVGSGDEKTESGYQEGVTIEGEISKRKVIFKPAAPELSIDRDVTVVLKFTVLPNGEVDQVFPYQKADPELEQLAIKMLHQYRFEPLFGSNLVQTGIIRFIIYRKSP